MIARALSVCKASQYQMEGQQMRWPTKVRIRPSERVWQWHRGKDERTKRVSLAAADY